MRHAVTFCWRVARRSSVTLALAIGAAVLTLGCSGGGQTRPQTTPYLQPIPIADSLARPKSLQQTGVPVEATRAAIPSDNQQTPEKIALGQQLFFDGRLSADGTVGCSTCHDPARAFTDGRTVSVGIKSTRGQRNAPTILNTLYNNTQFWDGRAKTLEEQAGLPIINPAEMGQPSLDAAVARIAPTGDTGRPSSACSPDPQMVPTCCVRSRPTRERKFHSTHPSINSPLVIKRPLIRRPRGGGHYSGVVAAAPSAMR